MIAFVALWLVVPAAAQPEPDLTIDAATRSKVIDGSLAALERYYVFPEMAKKIGAEIRKRVAARKYDQLARARAFAAALTTDHLTLGVLRNYFTLRLINFRVNQYP